MPRAASRAWRHGAAALLVLFACAACAAAAPSKDPEAQASAAIVPLWTAPPSATGHATATPIASPTPAPDAATGMRLSGKYRLVYRTNDASLTEAFAAGLESTGIRPRAAGREVWDITRQVGGIVVIDVVGMDLPDDALPTLASVFADRAGADLTWTTIAGRRIAVVSDADQRLDLFLLHGDLVVVAGIGPGLADDITSSLIAENA